MGGLDLTGLNDALKILLQYFNLPIAFIGLSLTEVAKKWIPDNIEAKWIPIVSVVICTGLSFIPQMKSNILAGIITGVFISGGYSVFMSFIKNFGANQNNNNTPAQPNQ